MRDVAVEKAVGIVAIRISTTDIAERKSRIAGADILRVTADHGERFRPIAVGRGRGTGIQPAINIGQDIGAVIGPHKLMPIVVVVAVSSLNLTAWAGIPLDAARSVHGATPAVVSMAKNGLEAVLISGTALEPN